MAVTHMMPWLYLGPLTLPTYGLFGATAFLLVAWLSKRDARAQGFDTDDVIAWAAMAGILGTRGLFLIQNPQSWQGPTSLIDLSRGGLVFYGALIALPVAWWRIRVHALQPWLVLDVIGRNLPLGHAIARLGCFAAGCCYGLPSAMPWAVTFTDAASLAPHDVALHPTQLYESAGLLLLHALLTLRAPHKRFVGEIMLDYLMGYAVLRGLVECFRGDADRGFFLSDVWGQSVSFSQAVAAAVVIAVLPLWWARARAAASSPAPTPTTPPATR